MQCWPLLRISFGRGCLFARIFSRSTKIIYLFVESSEHPHELEELEKITKNSGNREYFTIFIVVFGVDAIVINSQDAQHTLNEND